MKTKLTAGQSTLLRMIAERPNGSWCAHGQRETVERQRIYIGGGGMANSLRTLVEKGLLERWSLGHCYKLTDEGRAVAVAEKGKPLAFLE